MSFVDGILRRLGIRISRFQASPYEYLFDAPRYTEMTLDLAGVPFKIADAKSFYHSFREIFYDRIYEFRSSSEQPLIIDCGSNCGASVVYFKSIYPQCRIVAVEADPKIFNRLEWNVKQRGYSDIVLINKAVSVGSSPVYFYQDGADCGRIRQVDGCEGVIEIEVVHLDDLIDGQVDFLKMDIEGAEAESIISSKKLDRVRQCFIEYHSFKDSPQVLDSILKKLTASGFRYYIHKQFCSPRPLKEEKLRLGMDMQLNIFAKKVGI